MGLNKRSKTNVVELSTGEVILRSIYDRRITKAKERKWYEFRDRPEYDHDHCEDCGKNANGTMLDVSHNISVPNCIAQKIAEYAYDTDDMTIRCRNCHEQHDHSGLRKVRLDA